jgi:hypothetical protein
MRSAYRLTALLAVLGLLAMSSPALAIPLAPGGFGVTSGAPDAGGVLQASFGPTNVNGFDNAHNLVFTADVSESVFLNATGLLFEYKFTNTGGGTGDTISTMSVSRFPHVGATDAVVLADYDSTKGTSGLNPFPQVVSRSGGSGNVVTFQFFSSSAGAGIQPGQTTFIMYVQTNAHAFDRLGNIALNDGGNGNIAAFEPAAVPEPASLFLLSGISAGLVGVATWRKKRQPIAG